MAYSANKRQKVKKEEGRKEAGASKKVGKKSIFASLPGGLHQTNNFTQKERPFQAKAILKAAFPEIWCQDTNSQAISRQHLNFQILFSHGFCHQNAFR